MEDSYDLLACHWLWHQPLATVLFVLHTAYGVTTEYTVRDTELRSVHRKEAPRAVWLLLMFETRLHTSSRRKMICWWHGLPCGKDPGRHALRPCQHPQRTFPRGPISTARSHLHRILALLSVSLRPLTSDNLANPSWKTG